MKTKIYFGIIGLILIGLQFTWNESVYAFHCASSGFSPEMASACEIEHAAEAELTKALQENDPEKLRAASEKLTEAQAKFSQLESQAGLQGSDASLPAPKTPDESKINFGRIASMFVGIFTPLIAFLVHWIGDLMGSKVIMGTFVDGDTQEFSDILHTVWLIIRDLVNYLFILVLLAMAFLSVFGSVTPENNNYELKKLLPKFILSVVAVNFTWFGAQVILDAANVATNVVYAIPRSILGEANLKNMSTACKETELSTVRTSVLAGRKFRDARGEPIAAEVNAAADALLQKLEAYKQQKSAEIQNERLRQAVVQNTQGQIDRINSAKGNTVALADRLEIGQERDLEGCFPAAVFIKTSSSASAISGPVAVPPSRLAPISSTSSNTTVASGTSWLSLSAQIFPEERDLTGILDADADPAPPSSSASTPTSGINAKIAEWINKHPNDAKYKQDYGRFVLIWSDFRWERFQSNSIAALFAYNVLQVQTLPQQVRETLKAGVDIEDLVINSAFALLFMIIIIIAFVVMAIVLFERIIVIWMNIILSPLGALLFAIKDFGFEPGNMEEKGIGFKKFIKFAFLPALMGLPLVLGYILILAGKSFTGTQNGGTLILETEPINGVHTVQQLLWYVLAIGVLWGSVAIAEDTAHYLKEVVTGVTGVVKSVGKFVAKLPLYAQFIPIARGAEGEKKQPFSLDSLIKSAHNIGAQKEAKSRELASQLPWGQSPDISRLLDERMNTAPIGDLKKAAGELNRIIHEGERDWENIATQLNKNAEFKKALGLTSFSSLTAAQVKEAASKLVNKEGIGVFDPLVREFINSGTTKAPAAGAQLDKAAGVARDAQGNFTFNINGTPFTLSKADIDSGKVASTLAPYLDDLGSAAAVKSTLDDAADKGLKITDFHNTPIVIHNIQHIINASGDGKSVSVEPVNQPSAPSASETESGTATALH